MADSKDYSGFDYSNAYYKQQYGAGYDTSAYYGAGSSSAATFPFPGASGSSSARPTVANAAEYDLGIAAQQSAYMPGAQLGRGGAGGKVAPGQKRTTVLRKGAGKVWEDRTLLEWDSKWFRLFVGDLSNDVNEETLADAFRKYPTFTKARVIRDRLTEKAKYGFVAFSDPEDFLKAWKEMDGKSVRRSRRHWISSARRRRRTSERCSGRSRHISGGCAFSLNDRMVQPFAERCRTIDVIHAITVQQGR